MRGFVAWRSRSFKRLRAAPASAAPSPNDATPAARFSRDRPRNVPGARRRHGAPRRQLVRLEGRLPRLRQEARDVQGRRFPDRVVRPQLRLRRARQDRPRRGPGRDGARHRRRGRAARRLHRRAQAAPGSARVPAGVRSLQVGQPQLARDVLVARLLRRRPDEPRLSRRRRVRGAAHAQDRVRRRGRRGAADPLRDRRRADELGRLHARTLGRAARRRQEGTRPPGSGRQGAAVAQLHPPHRDRGRLRRRA